MVSELNIISENLIIIQVSNRFMLPQKLFSKFSSIWIGHSDKFPKHTFQIANALVKCAQNTFRWTKYLRNDFSLSNFRSKNVTRNDGKSTSILNSIYLVCHFKGETSYLSTSRAIIKPIRMRLSPYISCLSCQFRQLFDKGNGQKNLDHSISSISGVKIVVSNENSKHSKMPTKLLLCRKIS